MAEGQERRILTLDEIQTYCRIVTAIKNTIEIQTNVDEIYTQAEDVDPALIE